MLKILYTKCKICGLNEADNTGGICNDCFSKPQVFNFPIKIDSTLKEDEWHFGKPEPQITPKDEHNFYKKAHSTNLINP
jgi:hypothetical protein